MMRAKLLTLTSALALACAGLATSASAVGNNHGGAGSLFSGNHGSAGSPFNGAVNPGGGGGRAGIAHAIRPEGGQVRENHESHGDGRGRVDNDHHGVWNGDRDHDGDHHNGNWRHGRGVYLSFGNGYSNGYYNSNSGGCGYAYRRWQNTGSQYWHHRYLDCIG